MDDLSYYRDYDIKTLYQILEINKNNLQLLQQRHVLYGALHAPLPLINEINQIISTVRFITRIIQEKERVRYSQTISKDIVAKADIISKHKFHQLMSMLINLTNASAILAQNLRIITDKIKKNDQQSVISALDKAGYYIYDFGRSFEQANHWYKNILINLEETIEIHMLEYKSANKDEMARAELFVLKDLNTKAVDAKQMLQRLIRSLGNLPSRSTHPNIKSKPYLQTIISLEQSRQYVQQHVDQFYMYLNQMLQILWRLEGFISNLFV